MGLDTTEDIPSIAPLQNKVTSIHLRLCVHPHEMHLRSAPSRHVDVSQRSPTQQDVDTLVAIISSQRAVVEQSSSLKLAAETSISPTLSPRLCSLKPSPSPNSHCTSFQNLNWPHEYFKSWKIKLNNHAENDAETAPMDTFALDHVSSLRRWWRCSCGTGPCLAYHFWLLGLGI